MPDTALQTEQRRSTWIKASLVRIDFAAGPAFFTDGGFVVFEGNTYIAEHAVYGSLSSISTLGEGQGDLLPRIDLTFNPRDDVAVAALSSPTAQGSRVRWWEGSINRETGLLVGDPVLKFDGELDSGKFSVGDTWALVIECGTQAERQLEANADWRLNPAFHKVRWPTDTGLDRVTSVLRKIYWRMDSPSGGDQSIRFTANRGGGGMVNDA